MNQTIDLSEYYGLNPDRAYYYLEAIWRKSEFLANLISIPISIIRFDPWFGLHKGYDKVVKYYEEEASKISDKRSWLGTRVFSLGELKEMKSSKELTDYLKETGGNVRIQTIPSAEKIRNNNMEWYYLYHCVPLNGNLHLRTSVRKGFELMDSLEDHEEVTGRYPPKRYAVPLPIGKVSLDPSRIIKQEGKYIWIETRYTTDSLKGSPLPDFCRVGKKGFLEVKYLDGND